MSNKSRSQRSSASAPDDNSSNRRARRKEKANPNAEAGPSGSQSAGTSKPSSKSDSSRRADKNAPTANGDKSFVESDFIPFNFSDPEEEEVAPAKESSPPVREWDKGKGKGKAKASKRESEHAGRKRKADEIDMNDGYTNKKERMAAASRKAPWAKDVDWESCSNVAEMCVAVLFPARERGLTPSARHFLGSIGRWRRSSNTCPRPQSRTKSARSQCSSSRMLS